jgi:hypothetical protein
VALHKNLAPTEIHVVQSLTYADAATRIAATGFVAADIGRIAFQISDGTLWALVGYSPIAWSELSGSVSSTAKAGIIIPGGFSGVPKKATVTFGASYPSVSYAVTLSVDTDGTKTFAATIESKTAIGFVVNLNTGNVANLVEIGWHTMMVGS